jgi:hypothetical protein
VERRVDFDPAASTAESAIRYRRTGSVLHSATSITRVSNKVRKDLPHAGAAPFAPPGQKTASRSPEIQRRAGEFSYAAAYTATTGEAATRSLREPTSSGPSERAARGFISSRRSRQRVTV